MMFLKTNIIRYRKGIQTRINNLRKIKVFSHRKAARFMSLEAKKRAPKKTGALIARIRVKYGWRKSVVRSTVPKSFPYHFWINVTTPFKRIRLTRQFRPRGMKKRIRFYYAEIPTKTGMPRYFDIAKMVAARKFKQIIRVDYKNALRAGVTKR